MREGNWKQKNEIHEVCRYKSPVHGLDHVRLIVPLKLPAFYVNFLVGGKLAV
jgi:hypothetical protein